MDAAMCESRSRGMRKIRLETMSDMQVARRLYEKLGFREVAAYDGPRVQHVYELVLSEE